MAISIDFTNPEGDYPTEPMDWNTGNPFDLSQIYPSTAGLLFLGRDHDCAHTRYYIDDGLVLELQTTAVNQAFGLFVAKPAGGVNEIKIVTVFDFLGSLKQEIRTSAGHRTVPFIGSVGVVANNAKLVADENDDGSVPIGLTRADRRIAATCVLNYDPDGAETVPPSAPPSVQRLRLNAPGILYSSTGPKNPFHEFNFLRPRLSPTPRSRNPKRRLRRSRLIRRPYSIRSNPRRLRLTRRQHPCPRIRTRQPRLRSLICSARTSPAGW